MTTTVAQTETAKEHKRLFEPLPFKMAMLNGMSVYIGRDIQTNLHCHHLLEIVLAFDDPFHITDTEIELQAKGVIIGSDIPHQFTSNNNDYHIFIFIDPETAEAALLNKVFALHKQQLQALPSASLQPVINGFKDWFFSNDFSSPPVQKLVDELISALAPYHPFHPPLDARILNAIRYIKENLDSELDIQTVAAQSYLSESRFSHLFKEQIGIPLRRYVLWCRIEKAIRVIANGAGIAEAAYDCGFSDPAHLTRTFQEMFGVTPSQSLKY